MYPLAMNKDLALSKFLQTFNAIGIASKPVVIPVSITPTSVYYGIL